MNSDSALRLMGSVSIMLALSACGGGSSAVEDFSKVFVIDEAAAVATEESTQQAVDVVVFDEISLPVQVD